MSLVPLTFAVAAVAYDLRTREIPDWIPVGMLLALGAAMIGGWWPLDTGQVCSGALLGLALSGLVALAGGWGGGDVKLIAAAGGWLGPLGLLAMLFWMALAGLVLAIAAKLRGKADLAYAPAIATGMFVQLVWPSLLGGFVFPN